MSSFLPVSSFLRRILLADAVLSGATGALMAGAAAPLSPLLGLPAGLLLGAGLALLPFAAVVSWLATRRHLPRAGLWALVIGNALWAVDSVALLATGWVDPTLLGTAFVLLQAAVVAGLAELQVIGLRRAALAAA